ncbi:septation protein A [Solemya velesiana gill symbiont]|uniref:Inner membrane-spanning protein YciB n=1 Tax=Solemya velesiana gill symbiont TaxID=1918948 RepID=A0A1T2KUL6_9GAMM|nr:septation protein A [Solemya velesiana gill symbiont]OOZ36491.1 septation protein A [Solemya velesiana gill symbiont]
MKFLTDFFPVVLFFIAYQVYDIYVATQVAIAASFIQVSFQWLRHRSVPNMHLVTLGLLIIFGGLTLALRDPLFIKWKPTVVNWLFAVAFIGSQFIGKKNLVERMMSHAVTLPARIWPRLNTAWALFFVAMGAVNLYVAFNYSEETWVNFKLFGMMGLTFVFIILQALYMARFMEQPTESQEEI